MVYLQWLWADLSVLVSLNYKQIEVVMSVNVTSNEFIYVEILNQHFTLDENSFYLFISLFAGEAIGIVVNWAANDTFSPSSVSSTFLGLFIILTLICVTGVYRIHKCTK